MNACEASEFGEELERHRTQLQYHAWRLLGREAEEDDGPELVREAFARAVQHADRIERDKLRGWLYQVVTRLAFDWRRRQKHRRMIDRSRSSDELPASNGLYSTVIGNPRDCLIKIECEQMAREAMNVLSANQQLVIELHVFQDVPVKEIARITNVPVGTVRSRLRYAMRWMRIHLSGQNGPRRSIH